MSAPKTAYFYVMTEAAKLVFDEIFAAGVVPGKVVVLIDEDLKTLSEGTRAYPVTMREDRKIIAPPH